VAVSRAKVRKKEDKNRNIGESPVDFNTFEAFRPSSCLYLCLVLCVCALCCGVDKAELRSGACEDREVGGSAPWCTKGLPLSPFSSLG
jgi:hypothetical protein